MVIAASSDGVGESDEAEEVRLAKVRDSSVWSVWHDRYYGLIYRYAYARLLNVEDAEDAASQVFLEALKSIHRYRDTGRPILAWFYGIAHHMVSRKRRQVRQTSDLQEAEAVQIEGFEEASLTSLVLRQALDKLKRDHREVLILRFILALPTRRVAELLGKSEAATYSLQVRATTALRKALDGRS